MTGSDATLDALARLLATPRAELSAGLAAAEAGAYVSFEIAKGDGRTRRIDAPAPPLMALQRLILDRLLYRAPVSPFAHGFVPGRSIVTNARVHAATARGLVGVDLQDAYPSVSQARVIRVLEWFAGPYVQADLPSLGIPARRALYRALGGVCCHRGALPQGAPTSGALLNLACGRLDRLCARLVRSEAGRLGALRYSRYADDLTFTADGPFEHAFVERLLDVVRQAGFRANKRKIRRTSTREKALVVCGIRLHEGRLTLPRRTLRRLRALLTSAARRRPDELGPLERARVRGAIGFVTMVTPDCPAMLVRPLQQLVERHGDWLRPAVPPVFPAYGE